MVSEEYFYSLFPSSTIRKFTYVLYLAGMNSNATEYGIVDKQESGDLLDVQKYKDVSSYGVNVYNFLSRLLECNVLEFT
jgi:hypothetical protein